MTDDDQKPQEPAIELHPPLHWFRRTAAKVWHRKTTVIAALSIATVLGHLVLRSSGAIIQAERRSTPEKIPETRCTNSS